VNSATQRLLPDSAQRSQEMNTKRPAVILIRNPSKRAATNLRLKRRGHWDRPYLNLGLPNSNFSSLLRRKEIQKVMLQTLLHGENYPDINV
jgi:hypothetical protein